MVAETSRVENFSAAVATEPVNILVDAHVFDGAFQGTRTYLEGLYKAVFSIETRKPSGRVYFLAACNIEQLKKIFPEQPFIKFIPIRSRTSFQRLVFEFPSIIRKYRIDYAHFQYVVPFSGKCRYIVTIHDLLFLEVPRYFSWRYRLARRWLFERSYKKAAVVLTVSNYSRESIFKFYGREKEVDVVPNAIEKYITSYKPRRSKDAFLKQHRLDPYILYVSRFEERKNHFNLLKAFYEGAFYHTHSLVLIGKKSEPCDDFEKLFLELPETARKQVLIFSEGVSQEDLLEFLVHAQVFAYPSLAEGFGIPPLEAAALGTPVVCSNATAMKDFSFFEEGLADCTSAEQIATALSHTMNDADVVTRERTERIRQRVVETYDWERSASLFLSAAFKKQERSLSH